MSMLTVIIIPMFLRLAFVLLIAAGLHILARKNNISKSPMESMLFSFYVFLSICIIAWSTVGLVTDINSSIAKVRQQEELMDERVETDAQYWHEHQSTNQQDVIKAYEHE